MDARTSDIADTRFHIEWAPVPWDQRSTLTAAEDYGLYTVCGDHPVYGANVLLYIGLATQTFAARLSDTQHQDFIDTHHSGPFVLRVGRFLHVDGMMYEMWSDAITLSERILINSHAPAYNSQAIKGVLDWKGSHIHVFNWGDRGPLLPEASSRRFSYYYWDNDTFPWKPLAERA